VISAEPTSPTSATPNAEGETFEFQAEVSRVMDIIINSLYQGFEFLSSPCKSNLPLCSLFLEVWFTSLPNKS
jgi:hypothetical protein